MKRPCKKTQWLDDGIVGVQAIEYHHYRRMGRLTLEADKLIRKETSLKTANRLRKLGVNMSLIDFYMGFGLEEEKKWIEKAKKFAEKLHSQDIKVGVHTLSTFIFQEPFLAEIPKAINWLQIDQQGRIPTYYGRYSSPMLCINHEEYMEYLEKVLRIAVMEVKADLIFFDCYGYYSFSCACPECKKRFRAYLKNKYPTKNARSKRFGFANANWINPPPFWSISPPPFNPIDVEKTAIVDPIEQEWIDFRCQRLGEISRRINSYVKKLNSETMIMWNAPYVGPVMLNNALFHGVWPAQIYPYSDAICAECAEPPAQNTEGILETRIPYFKIGKVFHQGVAVHYLFNRELKPLGLAESMAYGQHPFDLIGPLLIEKLEPSIARYIQFYRDHKEYFKGAETLAEVGVWNSYSSLSYTTFGPLLSLMLFQQTLIQAKIPYDLIFDDELQGISKYPSLALPNVVAISDYQLGRLEEYLKGGGGLMLTDNTSLLNEHMLRRIGSWLAPEPRRAFADILGIEWPRRGEGPLKGTYGKGRFAIVPQIVPSVELPPTTVAHSMGPGVSYIPPRYLKLPKNWGEIVEAVNWTSGEKKVVTVKAPLTVTMELLRQEAENRLLLHLLNFDLDKAANNIEVRVKPPEAKKVSEVTLVSPDLKETQRIPFAEEGGVAKFTIPHLQTYGITIIQ